MANSVDTDETTLYDVLYVIYIYILDVFYLCYMFFIFICVNESDQFCLP